LDNGRKYKQHGYMDSHAEPKPGPGTQTQDPNGVKIPLMVPPVAASRCWNCSVALTAGTDFHGKCPKCSSDLHTCKQCCYFDPSIRFQCQRPVAERVARKDEANHCESFKPTVTVARDSGVHAPPPARVSAVPQPPAPRNVSDARAAFDNLFKK